MRFDQNTGLRNIARHLGIPRLLSLPSKWRQKRQINYYAHHRPTVAVINMFGKEAKFHTNSAFEWMRIQMVRDDEHILRPLIGNLSPGESIWDIGASIGAYTIFMAMFTSKGGEVVSFEPEDESRSRLLANISLNGLQNCRVLNIALGHMSKRISLQKADQPSAGTHRIRDIEPVDALKTDAVQMVSMDEWILHEKMHVPAIIKIDVEGFEEKVILGGQQTLSDPRCRSIMIEMHFSIFAREKDNKRPQRIRNTLEQCGFKEFQWIDPSHLFATK